MIRRICPICEQVMHSSHYCKYCRRWVRHPYIREVGYYLNERHPSDETTCSYHYGNDSKPVRKKTGGWSLDGKEWSQATPPIRQEQPKRAKNNGFITFIVILVIIRMIGSCASGGFMR